MAGNGMTNSVKSWVQTVLEQLSLKDRCETTLKFVMERPLAALLIGVALATSFIPAVTFVFFTLSFLVFGCLTLIIVEGTAIIAALVLLTVAMFGSAVTALTIGLVVLTAIVTARFIWRLTAHLRACVADCFNMKKEANCEGTEKNVKELPMLASSDPATPAVAKPTDKPESNKPRGDNYRKL